MKSVNWPVIVFGMLLIEMDRLPSNRESMGWDANLLWFYR